YVDVPTPSSPFSLLSSAHHLDLHSFPTRRSSDLIMSGLVPRQPAMASAPLVARPTTSRPSLARLMTASTRRRMSASSSTTRTPGDRKSTRLNSSHDQISYAVFCLKKKIKTKNVQH